MRLIVLAALVALAAAGAAAGDSGSAAETTTFSDAVGEDFAAPDIRTVVASNDDGGLLTFRIDIPSHPELTEDLRIRVWLDTDADPETGVQGADRYLLVDRWELGLGEVGSLHVRRHQLQRRQGAADEVRAASSLRIQ